MPNEYPSFEELLKAIVDEEEYSETDSLIQKLSHIRERGWFNKDELLMMGMWKSPRPKQHYLSNEPETVIVVSGKALAAASEKERATLLMELNGVSLPVVSAILTLINPEKYGVIDIRAWKLLYLYGIFDNRESGKGFSIDDWTRYLSALQKYAALLHTTPRAIDRSLYRYHKTIQEGNLYA